MSDIDQFFPETDHDDVFGGENPDGEWGDCPECGSYAYLDFATQMYRAQRPEMDDCARCCTCGG